MEQTLFQYQTCQVSRFSHSHAQIRKSHASSNARKSWTISRTEYYERRCSTELVLYYYTSHCMQHLSLQYSSLV